MNNSEITVVLIDKVRGEIIKDIPTFVEQGKYYNLPEGIPVSEALELVKAQGTTTEESRQFASELEEIAELNPSLHMVHVFMMID